MNYFLVKSDPDTYSFADLKRDGSTVWDGVHSFAAIRFINEMKPGDMVYVYESQGPKAIVGLAEVTDEPRQNPADPRPSAIVTLKYVADLKPISLNDFKSAPEVADFALVKQSRLSVMPVPTHIQAWIAARQA